MAWLFGLGNSIKKDDDQEKLLTTDETTEEDKTRALLSSMPAELLKKVVIIHYRYKNNKYVSDYILPQVITRATMCVSLYNKNFEKATLLWESRPGYAIIVNIPIKRYSNNEKDLLAVFQQCGNYVPVFEQIYGDVMGPTSYNKIMVEPCVMDRLQKINFNDKEKEKHEIISFLE
jgi:hypothetical protein